MIRRFILYPPVNTGAHAVDALTASTAFSLLLRPVLLAEAIVERDHHPLELLVVNLLVPVFIEFFNELFPLLDVVLLQVARRSTHH